MQGFKQLPTYSMRLPSLLIILILYGASLLPAQILVRSTSSLLPNAPPDLRLGVFIGTDAALHLSNFASIPNFPTTFINYTPSPGLPDDKTFRSGFTLGVAFGGLAEIPIGNGLFLNLRGGYASQSGRLLASQGFYTLSPNGIDELYPSIEHTLRFSLSSITGELALTWKPTWEILPNLLISAGLSAGSQSSDQGFTQSSRVELAGSPIAPPIKTPFVSGTFTPLTIVAGAVGRISYEIPLPLGDGVMNGRFLLTPELSAKLNVTPVMTGFPDNGSWSILHFRPVIVLKYELPRRYERIDEYEQRDTVRIQQTFESPVPMTIPDSLRKGETTAKRDTALLGNVRRTIILTRRTDTLFTTNVVVRKPAMEFSVGMLGVMPDGKENAVPEVRIEEIIGQKYFPLLNYIFFSEGASELAARYIRVSPRERTNFDPTSLFSPSDPLYIYHNILNVLADRMKRIPELTLTLTGCNADVGIEKGNRALSEARASAVKQYLCGTWGIAPQRVTIQSRNLPEKPSLPLTEADKREENRRVEITVSLPEYFKWIVTADTVRTVNPPTIRFVTRVESESPVRAWRLGITHKGDTVRRFDSAGMPPQVFDWEFAKEARTRGQDLGSLTEPFVLHPELLDSAGQTLASEQVSLPIKQITAQRKRRERKRDKEFEEFSMMLFEFNQAALTTEQSKTISFIQSHIRQLSEIAITGYTDRTGTAEYDRKLSLERAQQISRAILGEKTSPEQVTVRGVGKDELLYDNAIPEGRFYCRTVKVTIETPVN
jgi:outer membrane protein OmpA-like peptidoglycan-associated protein